MTEAALTESSFYVSDCEVCGAKNIPVALDLGSYPLCDALQPQTGVRNLPEFAQRVALCPTCLTAHHTVQVPKSLLFTPDYHYRSRLTQDVVEGCQDLVEESLEWLPQSSRGWALDIGCNDGTLLGFFKNHGFLTVGVEPTRAIEEAKPPVDLPIQQFFDQSVAEDIVSRVGHPSVITMTNVFAHIENLPGLLEALSVVLGPKTLLVIENHYLGEIVERTQFDTFYHEHPRTYSRTSFDFIAQSLECQVLFARRTKRYGGNIRVFMSRSGAPKTGHPFSESHLQEEFAALQWRFENWRDTTAPWVRKLSAEGGVAGKALPGRAVMLIKALGIDASTMPFVYEQAQSPKVGLYLPNSDIQILPDSSLSRIDAQHLIIWAWHIASEIVPYIRQIGYRGRIWNPMPELVEVD